jgi:hypothetical protein
VLGREAAALHVRLRGLQRVLVQVAGALGLSLVPASLVLVRSMYAAGSARQRGWLEHCFIEGGAGKGDGVLLAQRKSLEELPSRILPPEEGYPPTLPPRFSERTGEPLNTSVPTMPILVPEPLSSLAAIVPL